MYSNIKRKAQVLVKDLSFPSKYRLATTGITQSLLETFLRCRRCFLLALNRYTSIDGRNITAFGSLVHDCLDKIYRFTIKNKGKIPPEFLIKHWVQLFRKEQKKEFYNIKESEIEILCGLAYIILCEYVLYYKEDFKDKNWEAVEQVGATMFNGSLLRRKIDGKYRIHGKKWLLETKTMSRIELNSLLLKLTFDFQNLFYVTCEEADFIGDPVQGVLYNIIRNPSSRPHKGELLSDFLIRLREEIKKKPEHYFLRYEIPYTENDKLVFQSELIHILEEVAHTLGGILPIYKDPFACCGRFTCEYLKVCSSGTLTGFYQRPSLFPELNLEHTYGNDKESPKIKKKLTTKKKILRKIT